MKKINYATYTDINVDDFKAPERVGDCSICNRDASLVNEEGEFLCESCRDAIEALQEDEFYTEKKVVITTNDELKDAISKFDLESSSGLKECTNQELYDKFVEYTNYANVLIMNGHKAEGEKRLEQSEKVLFEIDRRCGTDYASKR